MKPKKNLNNSYDVIINGGGISGLTLALLLAQAEFNIAVIETKSPHLIWPTDSLDARVSALNSASQRLLQRLDVWEKLPAFELCSLKKLIAWDSVGGASITFVAEDLNQNDMGAIVENRALIRELWQALQLHQNVEMFAADHPIAFARTADGIHINLASEKKLTAQLLIGADGVHSWVRLQMGVEVKTRSYQQQALIAIVESEAVHQHTGWQAFLPEGTLALLPLSNSHHTALIWSVNEKRAQELLSLSESAFTRELNNDFGLRLGFLKTITPIQTIELHTQKAMQWVVERMGLVGDAGHRIHPLAGQGANLGLMDVSCLAKCLEEARSQGHDLGSLRVLRRYERARKMDHLLMQTLMDAFKKGFTSNATWMVQARNFGLKRVDQWGGLKRQLMRWAMG